MASVPLGAVPVLGDDGRIYLFRLGPGTYRSGHDYPAGEIVDRTGRSVASVRIAGCDLEPDDILISVEAPHGFTGVLVIDGKSGG